MTAPPTLRHQASKCPIHLAMVKQAPDQPDLTIGTATGFTYEIDNKLFLITNWHVVTGRDPFGQPRPDTASDIFPNILKLTVLSKRKDPQNPELSVMQRHRNVPFPLYDNSQPLWYEHPSLGSNCDAVALPISKQFSEFSAHPPVNTIDQTRIPIMPGGVAFVIGFPQGISISIGLPVWKAGYIASEPEFDITVGSYTIPGFFLDSLTRSGMSGSPVIAQHTGVWNPNSPYTALNEAIGPDTVIGSGAEFIGCYSGRVPGREGEAALGLCWRKETIDTICTAKHTPEHPNTTNKPAP